jgi:ribonuclease HI
VILRASRLKIEVSRVQIPPSPYGKARREAGLSRFPSSLPRPQTGLLVTDCGTEPSPQTRSRTAPLRGGRPAISDNGSGKIADRHYQLRIEEQFNHVPIGEDDLLAAALARGRDYGAGEHMEYPEEDALNIYTDGSMLPKPRRGGTGIIFILINEDGEEESYEPPTTGYAGATNNQMELEACVEALGLATAQHPYFARSRYRKIVFFSDSLYLVDNFMTAISTWSRNGWEKRDGGPVDNAKQWKDLVRLFNRADRQHKRIEIRWVRGKTSPRTKAVDKLAKSTAKAAPDRQLNPARIRRKRTKRALERGSVKMEGQRLTIRITKTEFQPLHRLTKCWYEVLSAKSPFKGRFDVVYADDTIDVSAGHRYHVRVNEEPANPRIAKVFREVEAK